MDGNVYPPEILTQLQQELKNMLKVVAALCDEFGLTWFVEGGTCLGAVRHKGFIPWDDDVDIALPPNDFRIFCEVAPAVLEGSGYGVYLPGQTSNYAAFFAKVYKIGTRFIDRPTAEADFDQGIFIDVFNYMQLDSDPRKAEQQIRATSYWQKMSYVYHIAHPNIPSSIPAKGIVRVALAGAHKIAKRTQSPEKIFQHFQTAYAKGNGQGRWMNPAFPTHGQYDTDTLFPTTMLPFEDMVVPVPHNSHQYLIDQYGDYMTLPPETERHSHIPLVLDFGNGVNVMSKAAGIATDSVLESSADAIPANLSLTDKQPLTIDEIRQIQLKMIDEIHRICTEHDLWYFLDGGSLIGAARHKGFIPWDDDVDISMLRKHYDCFIAHFDEWRSSERFRITAPAQGNCAYPYAVMFDTSTYIKQRYIRGAVATGVWIDLFPLDNLDMNNKATLNRINRLYWLRWLAVTDPDESNSSIIRAIKHIICPAFHRFVDVGKTMKKLDDLSRTQSAHETGEVAEFPFERNKPYHYQLWCYKPLLVPFEDREYFVPEGYDDVLTHIYGDWKTPVEYEPHVVEAYRL